MCKRSREKREAAPTSWFTATASLEMLWVVAGKFIFYICTSAAFCALCHARKARRFWCIKPARPSPAHTALFRRTTCRNCQPLNAKSCDCCWRPSKPESIQSTPRSASREDRKQPSRRPRRVMSCFSSSPSAVLSQKCKYLRLGSSSGPLNVTKLSSDMHGSGEISDMCSHAEHLVLESACSKLFKLSCAVRSPSGRRLAIQRTT